MLDDPSSGLALHDLEPRGQPGSDYKVLGIPQPLPSVAVVRCDIHARGCLMGVDHSDEMHVGPQAAPQFDS
jgi:hypothetical protein